LTISFERIESRRFDLNINSGRNVEVGHPQCSAEMSEAQRIESVREGRATLKEMVEGLLDDPDKLREVCRKLLVRTDVCVKEASELIGSETR
jgi:hypothetical protein